MVVRVKLIHGYGFAVICVIDSASEICGQLNIPSNKRRNNLQNANAYSYMYMYICFTEISLFLEISDVARGVIRLFRFVPALGRVM